VRSSWLTAVLFLALPCLADAQTAILQIRVVEGEGAVHAAGSRNALPLTVQVTDETGKPVDHAAVSFHLPDDGPGGTFLNGLRTDVSITDTAGRARVRGLQWNRVPGRLQIRIVASFEQVRAGTVSYQYLEGPALAPGGVPVASRSHSRWLIAAALAAGGAAAGILLAHSGSGTNSPAAGAASVTTPITGPPTIGSPTITVGKP
jgi:hypothetical protein